MPRRLDPERVARLQRLLAAGYSARAIARLEHVNITTILKIKHGRHCPRQRPKPPAKLRPPAYPPEGSTTRCPICRVLVYPPCYACQVRAVDLAEYSPPRAPQLALPPPRRAA